jgi:hypothetical protein
MKQRTSNPTLPVHDYSYAVRNAVTWLGERYLLAVPIEPKHNNRRLPVYFLQPNPWTALDKPRS